MNFEPCPGKIFIPENSQTSVLILNLSKKIEIDKYKAGESDKFSGSGSCFFGQVAPAPDQFPTRKSAKSRMGTELFHLTAFITQLAVSRSRSRGVLHLPFL